MGKRQPSVIFLTPLFPGTGHIALGRTVAGPPCLPGAGNSLSALKWLLDLLLLPAGELLASPGAREPLWGPSPWSEGQWAQEGSGQSQSPAPAWPSGPDPSQAVPGTRACGLCWLLLLGSVGQTRHEPRGARGPVSPAPPVGPRRPLRGWRRGRSQSWPPGAIRVWAGLGRLRVY